MNVDELLAADRELTDEEFEFLEQELLKTLREFNEHIQGICGQIEDTEPEVAAKLKQSAASALWNVEQAAAIPLHPAPAADLPDLAAEPPAGARRHQA